MALIYLTAIRQSPQIAADRAVPKVVSIESSNMIDLEALDNGSTSYQNTTFAERRDRYARRVMAAEALGEVYLMIDFNNAASSPYNTGVKSNYAAAGTTQATATALTAYHNTVTAACASPSIFGVRLPNASTTGNLRRAMVVKNAATADIQVYAAVSEYLDASSASTSSATVKAGTFKHFYCSTTTKWVTCKGPYY